MAGATTPAFDPKEGEPPTLTVPVRAAPALDATLRTTIPVPVPVGDAMVIHDTWLIAVQAQLVVTVTGSGPPVATTD